MSKSKHSDKYKLLDELFNVFSEMKYQPEDDELFEEWDIDIDSIVEENMMLFRQLKTKAKAQLNEMKHTRVKDFLFKLKDGLQANIKGYEDLTDEILSKPRFAELQPMFKNLSEVTEKDRQSILIDAKMLDILSEIEEEFRDRLNNEG